jgi:hypothetical protein
MNDHKWGPVAKKKGLEMLDLHIAPLLFEVLGHEASVAVMRLVLAAQKAATVPVASGRYSRSFAAA